MVSSRLASLSLPATVKAGLQRLVERHAIAHLWIFISPTLAAATATAQAFLLDWLGAPPGSDAHPDFLHLRPSGKAGLHSVASVRQMLERLSLSPFGSVGRAVLIDGADRMAPQTSNALLKVLEEPPPATTIVLTTSAPHLLLPTILSRSQVVRLPGKPGDSPLNLSSLKELLASPTLPSYSQILRACEALQKEQDQSVEGEEEEDGGTLWAQNTSKEVLEAVYLTLRKSSADPAGLVQNLLLAMNGIDRGLDLSTMLPWYLSHERSVANG